MKKWLDAVGGSISVAVEPRNIDYTPSGVFPGSKANARALQSNPPSLCPCHLHPCFADAACLADYIAPLGVEGLKLRLSIDSYRL
ncbi:hypothetical protein FHS14_004222 [Paenibacillus baekrokdamisoli]|uniref:hypothetical protein n=1 Tax=Paenibacillus baekrokdamisoli TaxID=1712516 RepID=UPI000F795591|nr:hypothetical protein [Paenibacillus baekrokdamisoli]MBB3071215.1 hypothetical protein [Paenibacillus baekrokdamisoli]